MSQSARDAIWAKERQQRWRRPILALPARKGWWGVEAKNDDGRRERLRVGISLEDAEHIAGRLRDACPDEDVAAGWNYLPVKIGAPGGPVAKGGATRRIASPHGVKPRHGQVAGHATSTREHGNPPIPSSTGGGGQASEERGKTRPPEAGRGLRRMQT